MKRRKLFSFVVTLLAAMTMIVFMTAAAFADEDGTNEHVGFKLYNDSDTLYTETSVKEGGTATVTSANIYAIEQVEADSNIVRIERDVDNKTSFTVKANSQGTAKISVSYLVEPKMSSKETVELTVHVLREYHINFYPSGTIESTGKGIVQQGIRDYFRDQGYHYEDVYVDYLTSDGAFPVSCWISEALTVKDMIGVNCALERAYNFGSPYASRPKHMIGIGRNRYYKDQNDLEADQNNDRKINAEGEVFKVMLAEMPRDLDVPVGDAKCGNKITYKNGKLTGAQPDVGVTSVYSVYTVDGKPLNEWYSMKNGKVGTPLANNAVLKGEVDYAAYFAIKPNFGYFFDEETANTIKVNSEKPLKVVLNEEKNILEVYGRVRGYHDWDVGWTTTKPTHSKEGIETYTCEGCGAKRTEPVPKLPYYVNNYRSDKGYVHLTGWPDVIAGDKVEFEMIGFIGYQYKKGTVKAYADETGEEVEITDESSFIMPESDVTMYCEFEPDHEHQCRKVEKQEPSCTEEGQAEYWRCSECGFFFWDQEGKNEVENEDEDLIIEPLGHQRSEVSRENVLEPTCTGDGSHDEVVSCERCGKTLSLKHVKDPAPGHSWGDWSVSEEATADKEGLEVRICSVCGEEDSKVIPKKEHEHGMPLTIVNKKAATCTESGVEAHFKCADCGAIFVEDEKGDYVETSAGELRIPAKGHTPGDAEKEEETPATCTSAGGYNLITRCSDCGTVLEVEHVTTDALGHKLGEFVKENRVNATYESIGGYDLVKRCAVCGEEIVKTHVVIPKLKDDEYNIDITTSVEGEENASGGAVAGAKDVGTKGESYNLKVKPDSGYEFQYWEVDGEQQKGSSYNLMVNAGDSATAVAIKAVFKRAELPYTGRVVLYVGEKLSLGEELRNMPEGTVWNSSDSKIAKVDAKGAITAVAAGSAEVTGTVDGTVNVSYTVIVKVDTSAGTTHKISGSKYKILSNNTVSLIKAKSAKTLTIPATIKIGTKTFKVTRIGAKAFKGTKVKTVIVKTKNLTKKTVRNSLKGSKVKTVRVKAGKKSVNKKYVKKYKKIFTKKNAGRKVTVK